MKKKLFFLVRHLSSSSSCFRYYDSFLTATSPTLLQSHLLNLPNPTNPYFSIPTLPFSTTTATATRKPLSIYLIERLGFSEEQSLALSKKLLRERDCKSTRPDSLVTDLISFEKSDNVIGYLKEICGLDLSQVKKLITKGPGVLTADVDKTLRPKVKLLQDLGFSTSDLALVLSTNPYLYLAYDLSPAIQALRGILGSDKDVVKALKGFKYCSGNKIINNLIPNATMLENEYGVPRARLQRFLTKTPKSLMGRTELLRDVLVRVEHKWGISRDSSEFLRALSVFCSNTDDNINSKCQVFRSYAWSESDIITLMRKHPFIFTSSEARLKKSLEFYMNELGNDPAYLASRPALLGYSLENRVVPRHKVLSILKEKGLIKADHQLKTAVDLTENRFIKRYILDFVDVAPELREAYINSGAPSEVLQLMKTSDLDSKTGVAAEVRKGSS